MIPDIELRLDSVRRALTEVILPAIDAGNSLAIEQTMLAIGHIGMIMGQADNAADYVAICFVDLAQTMADLPGAVEADTQAAAAALSAALSLPGQGEDGRAAYRTATGALEYLIRTADGDGNTKFRHELRRRVLAFTKRQAGRERSWFGASGFDPDARTLPSIADMISAARENTRGS